MARGNSCPGSYLFVLNAPRKKPPGTMGGVVRDLWGGRSYLSKGGSCDGAQKKKEKTSKASPSEEKVHHREFQRGA